MRTVDGLTTGWDHLTRAAVSLDGGPRVSVSPVGRVVADRVFSVIEVPSAEVRFAAGGCTPPVGSRAGAATDVPFPDLTTDGSPDGVQLSDRTAVICRSPARAGSLSDWPGPAGSLSCAQRRVVPDHAF